MDLKKVDFIKTDQFFQFTLIFTALRKSNFQVKLQLLQPFLQHNRANYSAI